jgi:ABC-2 type transport system ATP-binding protein
VLVSSHLMSEMEDTADHLVVVGRGRLLADVPVDDLLAGSAAVRVVSPSAAAFAAVLQRTGAEVAADGPGALRVHGLGVAEVGDLAFESGVRLHELTRVTASLEEAYLALTRDDVEYRAAAR